MEKFKEYEEIAKELEDLKSEKELYKILGFIQGLKINKTTKHEMLFRGQENTDYLLTPSIYRDNFIESENKYYEKIKLREPKEFLSNNIFDHIVTMQHYGLPTRLLDLTYNPLVALYFACSNSFSKNSVVYCFNRDTVNPYNSEDVKIVASIIETGTIDKSKVYEQIGHKYNKSEIQIDEIYIKNQYVEASYHNERIKRQQGAFILFGADLKEPYKCNSIEEDIEHNIFIPSYAKKNILDELELLGFNEGYIFPEFEHQLNYIKSRYRNSGEKPSKNETKNEKTHEFSDTIDTRLDNRIATNSTENNKVKSKQSDNLLAKTNRDIDENDIKYYNILKEIIAENSISYNYNSKMIIGSEEIKNITCNYDWYKKSSEINEIIRICKVKIKEQLNSNYKEAYEKLSEDIKNRFIAT